MKKLSTLPFMLLTLLFLISSCNNNSKVSLVGKWRPVELNIKGMSDDEKKDILATATIEFTRDGKMITTSSKKTDQGTYTYDEKNKLLFTHPLEGREEKQEVRWLEKNRIALSNQDDTITLKRD